MILLPWHLFLLAAVTGGSLSLGFKLFKRLGASLDDPMAFAASLALGFALCGYSVLALGQAGMLSPATLWVIVGLLIAVTLTERRIIAQLWQKAAFGGLSRPGKFLMGLAAFLLVFNAYRPETYFDALVYHLGLPQIFLLEGNTVPTARHAFTPMPLLEEMILTLGLGTGGEPVAKMLAGLLGLIAPLALYAWGRSLNKPKAGELATLLFLTAPIIFRNMTRSLVEPTLAGYLILALHALLRTPVNNAGLFLAGLFTGLMFAFKYFAGVWCATIFLLLCWRLFKENRALMSRGLALFFLGALIPALPWLLRNWAALGDPLYPYLSAFLGRHPNPEGWAHFLWEARHWHPGPRFISDFMIILKGSFADFSGAYFIGPGFLLVLPFAVKTCRRSNIHQALGVWTLGNWILGLAQTHYLRYLSPLLAPAAFLGALGFHDADKKIKRWLKPAIALVLAYHAFWMLHGFRRSLDQKAAVGLVSKKDYLQKKLGYEEALEWINHHVPADGRVLLLGETRAYGFHRRLVVATVHDRHPLADWIAQAANEQALRQTLKAEGITHIFHHRTEEQRIAGYRTMPLDEAGERRWRSFKESFLAETYADANVTIYEVR
ncbi:MAG: glycosyltransferase family 39 protein [Elusimicrobia bacterium]|nr:glycosyltransferase family 39 protein [Elusimicrobiota bacterium]